ncbi:MAG: D-alanyl-D-alanine carboxypeptidase family protein [Acidimicrobiia bacterium]|nr:D-alanyl-D-alanine carboxypeptidase family protein [Acidimicrobiia bacterium]
MSLAVVAWLALLPSVAAADQRDDLIERQRALIAELDVLEASDAELTEAIALLDVYVGLQQATVTAAQDTLAQALVDEQRARAAEEVQRQLVADLEEQMKDMAIAAYVAPPQADEMQTMLSVDAPGDAASLGVYLDVQNGRDTDVVRRLRIAREQLGDERRVAENAARRAEDAHEDAVEHLAGLASAREQQAALHEEVIARAEAAAFESDLVSLELARTSLAMIERAQAGGGRSVPLVSVNGIRVHRSVAAQVEALLAAAVAADILLGGGGYRDNSAQIHLRTANGCPDVWEASPSLCWVPTAIPGTSMHELGLAIDFTYRGATIGSHGSPAFRWLADNAHKYGFYNLPSEPWHWSVNGN